MTLRTQHPDLPPVLRSTAAHLLTRAAARGAFMLPRCRNCARISWPIREACPHCLGDIVPDCASARATVIACTTVLAPVAPYFRAGEPWVTGLLAFGAEASALAFLHPDARVGDQVCVRLVLDRAGQAVLYAAPERAAPSADPHWMEMTMSPQGRSVLITDMRHPAAGDLARMLRAEGAAEVLGGSADGLMPEDLAGLVTPVALDLSQPENVRACAARLGGTVDLLITTTDLPAATTPPGRDAEGAMSIIAEGLDRLIQAFSPMFFHRASQTTAAARPLGWVNLLSVFGVICPPGLARYGAAHAAALSLSTCLRMECLPFGLRVMHVLHGPLTGGGAFMPEVPMLRPAALAQSLAAALREGREELIVGDHAVDLVQRYEENPKSVERGFAFKTLS
ncbi:zinc ribbon domain-containing protein [Phaeovulum sp. W22_SRMD_FR3]|uniref:zinc ribbon domain-containing protein n=1 Tax=Phaeovulum sp. W22_SRMD_FR3 TaxID=3240274 RepID=UPI003F9CA076